MSTEVEIVSGSEAREMRKGSAVMVDALGNALDALSSEYDAWGVAEGIKQLQGPAGMPSAEELYALRGEANGPSEAQAEWLRDFIWRWESAEARYNDASRFRAALVSLTEGTPEDIDREVDAAFEALFPKVRWAIRGIDRDGDTLYWTGKEFCDSWGRSYTPEQKAATALPQGGEWVCGDCGQGDPTSVGHVCR